MVLCYTNVIRSALPLMQWNLPDASVGYTPNIESCQGTVLQWLFLLGLAGSVCVFYHLHSKYLRNQSKCMSGQCNWVLPAPPYLVYFVWRPSFTLLLICLLNSNVAAVRPSKFISQAIWLLLTSIRTKWFLSIFTIPHLPHIVSVHPKT